MFYIIINEVIIMKYKWIELYGYAGIYNGMALDHIKIDFSKCKTNKIIIRGSNGSGKSTLMKAINPNPDSNDNFIPNMEARKNICLIYGSWQKALPKNFQVIQNFVQYQQEMKIL